MAAAAATAASKRHGGEGDDEDSSWGSSSSDEDNEDDKKRALLAEKLKTLWGTEKEAGEPESNLNANVTVDEPVGNKKKEAKTEDVEDDTAAAGQAVMVQVQDNKSRQDTNKEVTHESKERANLEVENIDWSSSSEDFDEQENDQQNEDNVNTTATPAISGSECNSSNDQPSQSLLKSQKSQSWTGPTSTVFKENDLSSVDNFNHSKAISESDIVSSNKRITDALSLQTPANITLMRDSELSLTQSNDNIGDVNNEVRLARVTSSEILGEMELEFEINPFARGSQANSGQGDSTFVDPFKVKNEPKKSSPGKSSTKTNNAPIPYSKLLGAKPPFKSRKSIPFQSGAKSRILLEEDNTLDDITSSCSNSETPSITEPVPISKKPLFSRLKRKISKTFLRTSSSFQATKSLPTLSEETHPSPSKSNESKNMKPMSVDGESEDSISVNSFLSPNYQASQEELSNVAGTFDLEHQSLKLLKEAKNIIEKAISPEEKKEIQMLVQSLASKGPLDEVDNENVEPPVSDELLRMDTKPTPDSSEFATGHSNNGARHGAVSVPNYCETMDPCHPDPAVVANLLSELGCIYSKVLGSNCGTHHEYQNKFKQLAEQLKLAERCKSQLEMELDRLQNELKAMRRELDEEAQRRCNLEQLVCQQKAEIECLQDELCQLRGELDQIGIINEDLKNQMRHGMHDTQRFTQEIIDMQGALRERDEEIRRLKDALDRCCKRVEEMMEENARLRAEICKLQRDLEAMTKERDNLAALLECERREWNEERCLLDKINEKLKMQITCLEQEKDEICRKFKESTDMHHDELDCVRNQKQRFESLYEEEKKAREALEKKLRDCEEQKRLKEEQITMVPNSPNSLSNKSHSSNNSQCDQFRFDVERLENERSELRHARKCLELEKQLEDAQMERSVLMRQIQGYKSAQQQATQHQAPKGVKKTTLDTISNEPVLLVKETQTAEAFELPSSMKEDHAKEVDSLKEQLITLSEQTSILEQEVANLQDQLKNSVDEKISVVEENNNLKSTNASSKNRVEELTKTVENIKHETQKLEELVNERDARIRVLETEISEAQVEKSDLMRQIDSYKSEKKESLEIAKKVSFMTVSKGHTTSERETQTAKILDLYSSKKHNDQIKESDNLKKQLAKLNKQTGALEQEVEKLRNQLKTTVDEKTAVVEENKNLKIVSANSKAAVEESAKTNKAIKQETKQLKRMVNERDERIGALESVVTEVKRKYTEQRKQLRVQRIQLEALKADIEKVEAQNQHELSQLEHQKRSLLQEKLELETAWSKMNNVKKDLEKEKASLQNLKTMKERIESDVVKVQGAISSRMVDKDELETLKKSYEEKLLAMKSQFDAQLEMNRQLAEINEYLGRQAQDRALVDKIRDSNEAVLRKELSSVHAAMKLDSEKLKTLVKERDQEISSLRKSVGLLKEKYAKEAHQREELVKKVTFLSSISQECLQENNNAPVEPNPVSPQRSRIS